VFLNIMSGLRISSNAGALVIARSFSVVSLRNTTKSNGIRAVKHRFHPNVCRRIIVRVSKKARAHERGLKYKAFEYPHIVDGAGGQNRNVLCGVESACRVRGRWAFRGYRGFEGWWRRERAGCCVFWSCLVG
jgi:hypothetical protein